MHSLYKVIHRWKPKIGSEIHGHFFLHWGRESETTWLNLMDLSCHLIDWLHDLISILKCILVSTWQLRFNWLLPTQNTVIQDFSCRRAGRETCLGSPCTVCPSLFLFTLFCLFLPELAVSHCFHWYFRCFISVCLFCKWCLCVCLFVCLRAKGKQRYVIFMPSLFLSSIFFCYSLLLRIK